MTCHDTLREDLEAPLRPAVDQAVGELEEAPGPLEHRLRCHLLLFVLCVNLLVLLC